MYDDEFGDFGSDDPVERYNAHQRAKGRATVSTDVWDDRDKTEPPQDDAEKEST